MSYKECLIFIAYVKYLRTSSGLCGAEDKQVTASVVSLDTTDGTNKPHRTSLSLRRRKPKFTLEELLSQMPDYGLFCEAVKSGKLKPHRTPPPPRRRQKSKFTLEELLAEMPDDGGQSEVDTGPSVGNEVM